jgi:hypothetical protein
MRKRTINTTILNEWAGVNEAMALSGLSRCSLQKLLTTTHGEVENALVLGRRLVNLKSLSAYLSKLSREQAEVKP